MSHSFMSVLQNDKDAAFELILSLHDCLPTKNDDAVNKGLVDVLSIWLQDFLYRLSAPETPLVQITQIYAECQFLLSRLYADNDLKDNKLVNKIKVKLAKACGGSISAPSYFASDTANYSLQDQTTKNLMTYQVKLASLVCSTNGSKEQRKKKRKARYKTLKKILGEQKREPTPISGWARVWLWIASWFILQAKKDWYHMVFDKQISKSNRIVRKNFKERHLDDEQLDETEENIRRTFKLTEDENKQIKKDQAFEAYFKLDVSTKNNESESSELAQTEIDALTVKIKNKFTACLEKPDTFEESYTEKKETFLEYDKFCLYLLAEVDNTFPNTRDDNKLQSQYAARILVDLKKELKYLRVQGEKRTYWQKQQERFLKLCDELTVPNKHVNFLQAATGYNADIKSNHLGVAIYYEKTDGSYEFRDRNFIVRLFYLYNMEPGWFHLSPHKKRLFLLF